MLWDVVARDFETNRQRSRLNASPHVAVPATCAGERAKLFKYKLKENKQNKLETHGQKPGYLFHYTACKNKFKKKEQGGFSALNLARRDDGTEITGGGEGGRSNFGLLKCLPTEINIWGPKQRAKLSNHPNLSSKM